MWNGRTLACIVHSCKRHTMYELCEALQALCLHCNKLDGILFAMVQVTYRRRTRVYYMRKRNPSTNVRNASFAATARCDGDCSWSNAPSGAVRLERQLCSGCATQRSIDQR